MAYGTELILGFTRDEVEPAAKSLGLKVNWKKGGDLTPEKRFNQINKDLRSAYLACLKTIPIFTKISEIDKDIYHTTYAVDTPIGVRKMRSWWLVVQYDPDEMGDSKDDAILGISLISRYSATFIDWREPHGGSGGVICLDQETLDMVEKARAALVPVLPNFSDARICIKMIHY